MQQEISPKVSGPFLVLNILSKYPSTICLMEKKYVWTTPNIDLYSLFPLKIILLVKSKTWQFGGLIIFQR